MADGSVAADAKPARVWSPMQDAIFAEVSDGSGNLVVEALAGTGKSTTIEECVLRTDAETSVLVGAFNSDIAKALKPRMPAGVECSTWHSFGFKALGRTASGRLQVNGFHAANLVQGYLGRDRSSREARTFVTKLISVAKGQAFNPLEMRPSEGAELLDAWADSFGLALPDGWRSARERMLRVAYDVMRDQIRNQSSEIDFDDMIWLPIVRHLPVPEFDFVLGDETQDLNPAQLVLVRRASRNGRLVAVGDRHQSIYGFRGADPMAIPRIIAETSAKVLPLSVTYRCAARIVAEANRYVPALQAAPGAAEGVVRNFALDAAEASMAPGDFVLSRTNAPLVSLCFRLAKQGRRAAIRGRDIGDGLAAWVKSCGAKDVPELVKCVRSWYDAEVRRLEALDRDTAQVFERAECLYAFAEDASSIDDVLARIANVFSDADGADRIVLSSTHRAKGLEADRVWMLRDTYLKYDTEEERNLAYVAITRAKRELVYVFDNE